MKFDTQYLASLGYKVNVQFHPSFVPTLPENTLTPTSYAVFLAQNVHGCENMLLMALKRSVCVCMLIGKASEAGSGGLLPLYMHAAVFAIIGQMLLR